MPVMEQAWQLRDGLAGTSRQDVKCLLPSAASGKSLGFSTLFLVQSVFLLDRKKDPKKGVRECCRYGRHDTAGVNPRYDRGMNHLLFAQ